MANCSWMRKWTCVINVTPPEGCIWQKVPLWMFCCSLSLHTQNRPPPRVKSASFSQAVAITERYNYVPSWQHHENTAGINFSQKSGSLSKELEVTTNIDSKAKWTVRWGFVCVPTGEESWGDTVCFPFPSVVPLRSWEHLEMCFVLKWSRGVCNKTVSATLVFLKCVRARTVTNHSCGAATSSAEVLTASGTSWDLWQLLLVW